MQIIRRNQHGCFFFGFYTLSFYKQILQQILSSILRRSMTFIKDLNPFSCNSQIHTYSIFLE